VKELALVLVGATGVLGISDLLDGDYVWAAIMFLCALINWYTYRSAGKPK
jgi:hypothetical protein